MKKILSYHNSEELKQQSVNAAIRHMEEDSIVSGTFGEMNGKFRGCSVGCDAYDIKGRMVEDNHHTITAEHFGFPVWLEHLRDAIFEGLPAHSRNNFHVEVKKAIPVGVDLEPALHMLAIRRMDALIPLAGKNTQVINAINQVRQCHQDELNGEHCDWSAAWSVARSAVISAMAASMSVARSAARSAMASAERSARSAAESAEAAEAARRSRYEQERRDLIEILSSLS